MTVKRSKYAIDVHEDLGLSINKEDIVEVEETWEDKQKKIQDLFKIPYSMEQTQAVMWDIGTLIINACAGSGKTTTLCSNILYRAKVLGYDTKQMLAITFSNKASADMLLRYTDLVKEVDGRRSKLLGRRPNFKTFHAFFKQLLESHRGSKIDVASESDYTFKLLKQINDYSDKDKTEILRDILDFRGVQINSGKSPDGIKEVHIDEKKDGFSSKNYFAVINKYEELKASDDVIDFEDMQVLLLDILENNPVDSREIIDAFNLSYKYVYMDEYQDISPIQKVIFDYLLDGNIEKLTVIGDDDQSIYSFRGSDPQFIMDFKYNYLGSKNMFLSTNYRCPKHILNMVKPSISRNTFRIDKEMQGMDKQGHFNYYEDDTAFTELTKKIKLEIEDYEDEELPNSVAVLVRVNNQKTIIADSLITNKIPVNIGNMSSDLRSNNTYKLLNNIIEMVQKKDNELFAEIGHRIFNHINRNIIKSYNNNKTKNWYEDLIHNKLYRISDVNREILQKMMTEEDARPLYEMAWALIYPNLKQMTDRGYGNMSNYTQIYEYMCEISDGYYMDDFETLEKRKESMMYQYILNNKGVSILTMHSVKGLEFDVVFMPQLEDGIFPNTKKLNELVIDGKVLEAIKLFEEERRLFYVAWTRTGHTLYVSNTRGKVPNIFLAECDFPTELPIENHKGREFVDLLEDPLNYVTYVSNNLVKGYGEDLYRKHQEELKERELSKTNVVTDKGENNMDKNKDTRENIQEGGVNV